jgi:hypothetical protein
VIAWALLRDEKDWQPLRMVEVTGSFGPMPEQFKETLENRKPEENSDQRKKRLRKEARETRAARETPTDPLNRSSGTKSVASAAESSSKQVAAKSTGKRSKKTQAIDLHRDTRKFTILAAIERRRFSQFKPNPKRTFTIRNHGQRTRGNTKPDVKGTHRSTNPDATTIQT